MLGQKADAGLGAVQVVVTVGRGATPDELAERALNKILYVGGESHPAITAQAEEFKTKLHAVLRFYLNDAVRGYKATLRSKLKAAGKEDLIGVLDL